MKLITAMILTLALSDPVAAQDRDGSLTGHAFFDAVLVIPVALALIGEFFTGACEGTGHVFEQGAPNAKPGEWGCYNEREPR